MVVLGVDEVGRGCWAGPLVAGAVILKQPIEGLTDSKLLSKTKRHQLDSIIRNEALAIGLGWVTALEVDMLGLTEAVRTAMQRAVAEITRAYDQLVIDGNYNFFPHEPRAIARIRADSSVPAVSAASVIAKVARDAYMCDQAVLFPEYGFEKHSGYGTYAHRSALQKHGICELHRKSYKPVQALCMTSS